MNGTQATNLEAETAPAAAQNLALDSELEIKLDDVILHDTFKLRSTENLNVDDLAASIKEHGLIHKPTVRPIAGSSQFELIAGFRRFHALKKLGLVAARFSVRSMDDRAAMSIALTENAARKDLTPIEEAKAFKTAIEKVGMMAKDVARDVNKSESYVSNRLKLLDMAPGVIQAIDSGKILPAHAEHGIFILKSEPDLQEALVKRIISEKMSKEDAKLEARRLIDEKREHAKFEKALEEAKILGFHKCPKPNCGKKATGFDWSDDSSFKCENYHVWNRTTGVDRDAAMRRESLAAAHEARKNMEAPRTAYFDTSLEAVEKLAYRKAIEVLKAADLKDVEHITLTISGKDYESRTTIEINVGAKVFFDLPGGACFTVEKKDEDSAFVKTYIAMEPTRKLYKKMAEVLEYPAQVTPSGKPSNNPIVKVPAAAPAAPADLKTADSGELEVLTSKVEEAAP